MSEWQLIDTAPKTGQQIILCVAGDVFAGFWHGGQDNYWGYAGWYDEAAREHLLTAKPYSATHWQPLPSAPLASQEERQ